MLKELLSIAGVSCSSTSSGIKENDTLDLSLISLIEGSVTAAVFTQNVFCAAPILVAKNHLKEDVRAIIINSGNANAGTGKKGLERCYGSCEIFANILDIKPQQVMPFSTGVIGRLLPLKPFNDKAQTLVDNLSSDNMGNVAKGILTTDLVEKCASVSFECGGKTVNISGIAKGSGMIRPDMATMLSFIFSDIGATQKELQECLVLGTNQSFNRITVDGDTSTNDACTLSATNQSGVSLPDCAEGFQKALNSLMQTLAHKIVKDGEGATKFVEIKVSGLSSQEDCLEMAYTVAHSPLVKTALFSSEANWGRVLAAVGRSRVGKFAIEDVNIYLNDLAIIIAGEPDAKYTEESGITEMAKSDIVICIKIGQSKNCESVWTTDLSYEYVKINAEYLS